MIKDLRGFPFDLSKYMKKKEKVSNIGSFYLTHQGSQGGWLMTQVREYTVNNYRFEQKREIVCVWVSVSERERRTQFVIQIRKKIKQIHQLVFATHDSKKQT